ncbi:MAG: peptidyl-prolyl cis-trans isomerase [Clostridia bacterium]|nr:peptidyl-prolyl cis-trans isomerase [Clostridia bacterium]
MDEKEKSNQPENPGSVSEDTGFIPGDAPAVDSSSVNTEPLTKSGPDTPGGIKPVVVVALSLVLILVTALISANIWRAESKPVAVVNGEKVSQSELYQEMYMKSGEESLHGIITQRLIQQEARANKVSVSDEDVKERLDRMIAQDFQSEENFEQLLKIYNLTKADIEEQLRTQLIVETILSAQLNLGDEELERYFNEHRQYFSEPVTVEVRHIQSDTRADAKAARTAVAGGADFAQVAKERSTDDLTASKGGELGKVPYSESLPQWVLAAFELKVGELSNVLESESGFHVLQVTELSPAVEPSFEEVKSDVQQAILEERMSTLYPEWMDSLWKKAKIEYKNKEGA